MAPRSLGDIELTNIVLPRGSGKAGCRLLLQLPARPAIVRQATLRLDERAIPTGAGLRRAAGTIDAEVEAEAASLTEGRAAVGEHAGASKFRL
jgi:hypothetical protein